MKKFKLTKNDLPTDEYLDSLWQQCVKARAKNRSELSGSPESPRCGHHIYHKPNLRLRWALEFGICLTNREHARYHEFEKRAFPSDRKIADDMRERFLKIRGMTEEIAMILKRQTGGIDRFAVKIYLLQKLKEFSV